MEELANPTIAALEVMQISIDTLANVVMDNRLALYYLHAEQGGDHAITNTSCCTWIKS